LVFRIGKAIKSLINIVILGKGRDHMEDNIRKALKELDGKFWTGFIRIRIGTNGSRSL
jgi:hypothetical protein